MRFPRHTHSARSRDVALRRLSRCNRWLVAGSVAFTGLFWDLAAQAFPGKTLTKTSAKGTSTKSAASQSSHHHHATHVDPASTSRSPEPLKPPAQAPESEPSAPEQAQAPRSQEAQPTEAQPTEAQPTHVEQTPAPTEAAPTPETQAPAAPAPEPVVSGGS